MSKLKTGRAGGRTSILPELLFCGGAELLDRLLILMEVIWKERTVVRDWENEEIALILKKRELKMCDNWGGSSLSDLVGKILGKYGETGYRRGQSISSLISLPVMKEAGMSRHDFCY